MCIFKKATEKDKDSGVNCRGFTLVEFVITIAILGLVLYPIYEFLRQGALSWQIGEYKTEVVQNARIGLDKMCDEIKHAVEFYTISSAQIRFWFKDLNKDKIADADEILTYSWSGVQGEDLTRKLDSETTATPIANYVDTFILKYYSSAGAETTDVNLVYFITASLRIKKTVGNQSYTSTMRKSVHSRNLQ